MRNIKEMKQVEIKCEDDLIISYPIPEIEIEAKFLRDEKMRCARFLLQMFQKYGVEVHRKHKENIKTE